MSNLPSADDLIKRKGTRMTKCTCEQKEIDIKDIYVRQLKALAQASNWKPIKSPCCNATLSLSGTNKEPVFTCQGCNKQCKI